MAELIKDYYSAGWRELVLTCEACQWRGDSRGMVMELHNDVTDYACPACENMLLIVTHPSLEQVHAAAAAGNAEALQQVALMEEYQRRTQD